MGAEVEPKRLPVVTIIAVGAVLLIAAAAVGFGVSRLVSSTPSGQRVEYVIPLGTWERMRAGERPELVPREINLEVGDTLVIRNDDISGFEVGPFAVGPETSYEQTFTSPRQLTGDCVLHPDGQVTINVTERRSV